MAAPSITLPQFYVPASIRHIDWVPTIASTTLLPTRAEINAGLDLTAALPPDGVDGWTPEADFAEAPTMAGGLTAKVSKNTLTAPDSSLTFYMDKLSSDIRATLPRGTNGYVIHLWEGDIAGRKMTVFQVTVASQAPLSSGAEPAQIKVGFSLLAFAEMLTVPA